jgi:hypothetical protein
MKKPKTVSISEDDLVEHLLKADNVLHYLAAKRALKIKGASSWKSLNLDLDEWYRMLKKIMKWAGTKRAKKVSESCDEWLVWKPSAKHPSVER